MTGHVKAITEFIESLSLIRSWDKYEIDFTHCYEINGNSLTNKLDHWFWTSELNKSIEKCGVHHLVENKSDHSPIFVDINTECLPSSSSRNVKRQPSPSWKKATTIKQKAFTDLISRDLNKITVPQDCNCTNVHCRETDHIENIDKYVLNILDTVEVASKEYLVEKYHCSKNGRKKTIPGWNEYVAPALDEAKFWHAV